MAEPESLIRYEKVGRVQSSAAQYSVPLQSSLAAWRTAWTAVTRGRRQHPTAAVDLKGCYVGIFYSGAPGRALAILQAGFAAREWEHNQSAEGSLASSAVMRAANWDTDAEDDQCFFLQHQAGQSLRATWTCVQKQVIGGVERLNHLKGKEDIGHTIKRQCSRVSRIEERQTSQRCRSGATF